MSCDHTCPSGDLSLHLNTSHHKQIEARKSLRRTPSQTSKEAENSGADIIHDIDDEDHVLHIDEEDNVPQSDIVEILDDSPENSPSQQQVRPSLTISRAKPSLPSQRVNYHSPARSAQIITSFPRPPSPADSVMEIEVHHPPSFSLPSNLQVHQLPSSRLRPPSPAESVMEVHDSRPVSPSPSIMELDRATIMHLPVTPSRKNRLPAFSSPSQMRPALPYNYQNSKAGPSWVLGATPTRGRSPKNHSPRPSTSTVQRSNGLPTPIFMGNARVLPKGNAKQRVTCQPPLLSSTNMRNQYECKEPCKMSFSSDSSFKEHAVWHENTNTSATLECHICQWRATDRMVGQKVTSHLYDIRHTVKVTKKLSACK